MIEVTEHHTIRSKIEKIIKISCCRTREISLTQLLNKRFDSNNQNAIIVRSDYKFRKYFEIISVSSRPHDAIFKQLIAFNDRKRLRRDCDVGTDVQQTTAER